MFNLFSYNSFMTAEASWSFVEFSRTCSNLIRSSSNSFLPAFLAIDF